MHRGGDKRKLCGCLSTAAGGGFLAFSKRTTHQRKLAGAAGPTTAILATFLDAAVRRAFSIHTLFIGFARRWKWETAREKKEPQF
jgi:hypothetical protein